MRVHTTKYSTMTDEELISFAQHHLGSLSPLGLELFYRLEKPEDREATNTLDQTGSLAYS